MSNLDAGTSQRLPVQWWAVAFGLVAGTVGTLIWATTVAVVGGESLEASNPGGPSGSLLLALVAAPLVVAVALVTVRDARRGASGFWFGLATATVLVTALCVLLLAPDLLA